VKENLQIGTEDQKKFVILSECEESFLSISTSLVGEPLAAPENNIGAGFPRPREAERLPYNKIDYRRMVVGASIARPYFFGRARRPSPTIRLITEEWL